MISLDRSSRTWLLCAAAFLTPVAALRAASPRDELLRFVPNDAGFCFVMQDLRVHAAELADSPFVEQVRKSPLGAVLQASKELVELDKIDQGLRQSLGVGFDQLRDDLLGDAAAFAYRPGPPDKPDQEQGLILVRARTAAVLSALVEKINAAQKKDGSLTDLQALTYKGATYFLRVEPRQTNYYAIRGPVLLFTSQEEMLQRAIDADQSTAAGAAPPLASRLHEIGADHAVLALWVNPRAFDAGLEAKAAKADATDAPLQKKVLTYWKAAAGVAVWADLDKELHLSLAVEVNPDELPAAARNFLTAASRRSAAWDYFPDDALLACGGRIDAGALLDLLQDFQPASDASTSAAGAVLGKNFLKEVLSHVGPDWGLCVTAPPADGKEWLPQALLVVRIVQGDDTAPVDQALASAVQTSVLLGVLGYNHDHATEPLRLASAAYNHWEIHYLTGDRALPAGLQPAYSLVNGWLTFASTPDVIRRFADAKPPVAVDDGPTFPLLRISVKAWRAYLKERREPLAAALAQKNQLSAEEVRQRLDDLIGALQLVDRVEIDCRTRPGAAVVTLTVQTAQPLKKVGG